MNLCCRLSDVMVSVFGAADGPLGGQGEESKEDAGASNAYPEPEVDEMRAQRDVALANYIHERERREAMAKKLAATVEDSAGGREDTGDGADGGSVSSTRRGSGGGRSSRK